MIIEHQIKNLIEELRNKTVKSPSAWLEDHGLLAGQFAFLSEQFADLENHKNTFTSEMKAEVKSDAQAERIYLSTEAGQSWTKTKLQLKYLEKLLSSIKLKIEIEKVNFNNS